MLQKGVQLRGKAQRGMNRSDIDGESIKLLSKENYDAKASPSNTSSPASDYEEKTEVIYGEENTNKWAVQTLSTVTRSIDLCGDRNGPSIIIASKQILQKYIELHRRGVKQRVITEIDKENIVHCKELMKFQELRHLDGLKGFLGIADMRVLTSNAFGQKDRVLPHMLVSTVKDFVEQQHYFFETLWNKATPQSRELER